MRCRHERNSWLMPRSGLWLEWCWKCGAIRNLYAKAPNKLAPASEWTKPTGPNGENPCEMKPLRTASDPPRARE